MASVTTSMQDGIALLRLDNGITNAISSELVADLSAALAQVQGDARGLILAGNEKFFSIGLNLPELITLDRAGMTAFFTGFDRLAFELYSLPIPTACAITGHAVAGGCVLALTCDFRFAAEGKKLFGFNEATIGLPVPYLPDLILRQLVGDRAASEMMYLGQFLTGARAAEIGLIDSLLPPAEVEEQALGRVRVLAAQPPTAFAILKENRTDAVRAAYRRQNQAKLTRMLDCWFEDSVQALLRGAVEKF